MSFSKPTVEVSSPVEAYIDLNARDGEITVLDNVTKEKTVIGKEIKLIIIDSNVAQYGGFDPAGDHFYSNHFRSGRNTDSYALVQRQKSGVVAEGKPLSQAFKDAIKPYKGRLKYQQLLFCYWEGMLAVVKVRGLALNSWIESRRTVTVDAQPVLTISVGDQVKTTSGLMVYEYNFSFAPLPKDEELYNKCVEMDKTVQAWLDAEYERAKGRGESEPEVVVEADEFEDDDDDDISADF